MARQPDQGCAVHLRELPSTGRLAFAEATGADKAQQLEAEDRTRYLRVIGIDATTPEDFRAATKKGRAKKTIATKTNKKT